MSTKVSAWLLVLHCFPRWWKVYDGRRNLSTGGRIENHLLKILCLHKNCFTSIYSSVR